MRKEIEAGRGTQFDPEIADKMLEIIDNDPRYELRQFENDIYNILVIDDDMMIIKHVIRIMKQFENIHIYSAQSVKETFSVLEDTDIALILMDLKMPEISGFDLYLQIREKYSMPVVMMTGDRSVETIERIRELKIDDYLTKPLNGAITRETVHGVLQRTESQRD